MINEGGHSNDSNSQKHEVLGHRHKLGSVANTRHASYPSVTNDPVEATEHKQPIYSPEGDLSTKHTADAEWLVYEVIYYVTRQETHTIG